MDFDDIERKELEHLEAEIRQMKASGWGFLGGTRLQAEFEHRRSRLNWYVKQRNKMMQMCTDYNEAKHLWGRHCFRLGDWPQRLLTFQKLAHAKGLAPREILDLPNRFIDPAYEEEVRKQARELTAMKAAIQTLIAESSDAQAARTVYNTSPRAGNPISWDRVDGFCTDLVNAGLLGQTWRGKIGTFRAKMKSPATENKMMNPAVENK